MKLSKNMKDMLEIGAFFIVGITIAIYLLFGLFYMVHKTVVMVNTHEIEVCELIENTELREECIDAVVNGRKK